MDGTAMNATVMSALAQHLSSFAMPQAAPAVTAAGQAAAASLSTQFLTAPLLQAATPMVQRQSFMLAAASMNPQPPPASAIPVFAQYTTPVVAPTPSSSGSLDLTAPLYYPHFLGSSTPVYCTCACSHEICPVHASAFVPSALPSVASTAAPPTPLLSNPIRHVVVPSPQMLPQPSPSGLTSQIALAQQQMRVAALNQQNAAAAVVAVAAQQNRESLRLKRHQTSAASGGGNGGPCGSNSDGRPMSKVRRVVSIEESVASSSQLGDRNDLSELAAATSMQQRSGTSVAACRNCQQRFCAQVPPYALCLCHNNNMCEYSNTVCHNCYSASTSGSNNARIYNNPSSIESLSSAHRQLLHSQQAMAEQRQQGVNNFYRQNTYDANQLQQLAATAVNVFNPNVMLMNGARPLMEFFLLSEAGILSGTTSATASIQTLHQVLSQNPHMTDPVPVGASLEQIKKTTTISNYLLDPNVPELERERCTVCLSDFETGDDVRTLNCNHMFHVDCIDRWLTYNKRCPVCRVEIDKPAVELLMDRVSEEEVLAAAAL